MRHNRGAMRPVHLGTRRHVPLKIVSVQLDQSRRHKIALHVTRPRRHRSAAVDAADPPAPDPKRSKDHLILQNKPRIGEYCVVCH